MIDANRPIYTLTVGEFIELYREIQASWGSEENTQQQPQQLPDRRYVYGILGLAQLFNCSKPTAQKIKNSGKIDAAIFQEGRKIIVDAEKALELLSNNQ